MAYLQQVRCKSIYQKMGLHTGNPTDISDFEPVTDKVPVFNPAQFFRDHGRDYFVCCADFQTKALVLVKAKDMSAVRKAPFFCEALRLHAEELLVIPFTQLEGVAAEVAGDVAHITTIFVHITMRCGSTLLIKALEASGSINTVSESDVYTSYSQYALSTKDIPKDDMETLFDVIRHTNTLFNYTLFLEKPTKTVTCYKMRGQVCPIADLLRKALPEVKNVFLYRSLVGTVDSYAHLLFEGSYWKYWLLTALKLDSFYLDSIANLVPASLWESPLFNSIPVPHGIVWFSVCVWLELMHKAFEIQHGPDQRFHAVLRYEELCKYKEDMVLKVMDILGINCGCNGAKGKIREVFGVDSQRGHRFSSRGPAGGESWVGDWEMVIILKILDHVNMGIKKPDFVLNGTITYI